MTTVGEQSGQNTRHHPGFEAAEGRPKATSVGKPCLDGNGERPTATSAELKVGDIGTDDAVIVADVNLEVAEGLVVEGVIGNLGDVEEGVELGGVVAIHQIGEEDGEDGLGKGGIEEEGADGTVVGIREEIGDVIGGLDLPVLGKGGKDVDEHLGHLGLADIRAKDLVDDGFPGRRHA